MKHFITPDGEYFETITNHNPDGSPVTGKQYIKGTIETTKRPDSSHKWVNGSWLYTPPKPKQPHVPRPAPDRDAAILAIITALTNSGMDMTEVQAAMDRME